MISQDKILEIRNRASIVEVISDYVTLRKAGRNYMGLCPFHTEKSPSFTVSDEKGIFHCFGCQTGGSVFQFLMHYDRLTFPEAVERVAKRYGIALEPAQAGARAESGERESLYRINERIAANYQQILMAPEGKRALEYIQARGVDEATARLFMLGYAPKTGSGILDLAKREKFSIQDVLRLGLLGQRQPQQFYEKFFTRVMFPIVNPGGKVVGFGGRVLDQAMPKYLNSSETPLFHKSSTLYGLFQAKEGIRRNDRVVVVEGYLDVMALFQFGVSYAVATLGTALTVDHVRVLSRYTKNIIALFDGDEAGRKAAARSFEIFIEAGMLGRAAFLPKGDDPDTFVRRVGKAALEGLLEQAVPLADYYFAWLENRHGRGLQGKSEIATEVSRVLNRVKNPFEVDLLARRASDMLGIREELLRGSLADPGHSPARPAAVQEPVGAKNRDDIAERSLISLMLRSRAVVQEFQRDDETSRWIDPQWKPVVDVILGEWHERDDLDVFRVAQKLSPEMAVQVSALALEAESVPATDYARVAADCLSHLRRKYLRGLERNLRIAIRAAEEQKDEKAKRERILEWQDIVRKERQLERRKFEPKSPLR